MVTSTAAGADGGGVGDIQRGDSGVRVGRARGRDRGQFRRRRPPLNVRRNVSNSFDRIGMLAPAP